MKPLDFCSREGKINRMQQRINDNLKLAKEAGRLAVLKHEERCVAVIETSKDTVICSEKAPVSNICV